MVKAAPIRAVVATDTVESAAESTTANNDTVAATELETETTETKTSEPAAHDSLVQDPVEVARPQAADAAAHPSRLSVVFRDLYKKAHDSVAGGVLDASSSDDSDWWGFEPLSPLSPVSPEERDDEHKQPGVYDRQQRETGWPVPRPTDPIASADTPAPFVSSSSSYFQCTHNRMPEEYRPSREEIALAQQNDKPPYFNYRLPVWAMHLYVLSVAHCVV